MEWTVEQQAHVLSILHNVTNPGSDVQAQTMLEVDRLSSNPVFPHILAYFLAYGSTTAPAVQQTAGILLKRLIVNRASDTIIQNPRSLEIPLLIGLCNSDSNVRTAAGCCISTLLTEFPCFNDGLCENQGQQSLASDLIATLRQLLTSAKVDDQNDGNGLNKYFGVSTCIGILFEDKTISALLGSSFTNGSLSMLGEILHLITDMIHNCPYLEVKLNLLNTTHEITLSGAINVSDLFDSDDSDYENNNDFVIKGRSPLSCTKDSREYKEERKNLRETLKGIEQTFVINVFSAIPEILQLITNSSSGDHVILAKGYTCVLRALFPMIAYWDDIKGPVTQNIMPIVIKWLVDFNIFQQSASQIPMRHQSVQILLEKCVELITEVAQQIDCELATECVNLHREDILRNMFYLSYLDCNVLSEISVGRDKDDPDSESEVIFTRRQKVADIITEQETEFNDGAFGEDNEDECRNNGSYIRSLVNSCISTLSMVIPVGEMRSVTSKFLEPIIHELLVDPWTTTTVDKWVELEAALAFLGEIWAETIQYNSDEVPLQSIMDIISTVMVIIDYRQGHAYPIAPVRSTVIHLIKKLVCALISLITDDEETLSEQKLQTFAQCSLLVNECISLLIQTIRMDENKNVICTAIETVSQLILHSFVCDSRENDENLEVTGEQYVCKESISTTHIIAFYELVRELSSFQMRPRVTLYNAFCSIIAKDIEKLNSIFVPLSENFMLSLLEQWRVLSILRSPIHASCSTFHPEWLVAHESIAIGDLLCSIIDCFEDNEIICSSVVINRIWYEVCSPVLEMRNCNDGFHNLSHLELESLGLAIDLASSCSSACSNQVALQLFQTSLVNHVAHIVSLVATQSLQCGSYAPSNTLANMFDTILGAGYGLLGTFCSITDKGVVLTVADELMTMIMIAIRQKTTQEQAKLPVNTNQRPTSIATTNAFWCFSQLLMKIVSTNGNPGDGTDGDMLLSVCKNSFSHGVPETLCKNLIFLVQRSEQDSDYYRENNNFNINLLAVTIKMAELFPETFLTSSEGSELPIMLLIRTLSRIASVVEDITEMIGLSLGLGKLLHQGLKQQVSYDFNVRKQLVTIAGYTATSIKKCRKSKSGNLSDLGVTCQAIWNPIVQACYDAIPSVFPRGKVKDRSVDLRKIFC